MRAVESAGLRQPVVFMDVPGCLLFCVSAPPDRLLSNKR